MPIVIPTYDLRGILTDTLPFACVDPEYIGINAICLEWDGHLMHALSTDRYRIAWSQWSPDDAPEVDTQDDLFMTPGGDDAPWSICISLDDAKHLHSTFKLKTKEEFGVPLLVECVDKQLIVRRGKESGHAQVVVTAEAQSETLPDVRALLKESDRLEPVHGIAFDAKKLADFGKVRQRGPMEVRFTGERSLTHVSIGDRFVGAIMPVRTDADNEPLGASS